MKARESTKDPLNRTACRLKQGDRKAGEKIFQHFRPGVFSFCLKKTGNRQVAEDLTQEVFLKIFEKIGLFDETLGNFSGWVWEIARNTLKDYYRQKKAIPLSDLEEEKEKLPDKKQDLAKTAQVREVVQTIKTNLKEDEKKVFQMRYLSNLSYKEISRETNRSPSSLRILMHRMTNRLKQFFQPDDEDQIL